MNMCGVAGIICKKAHQHELRVKEMIEAIKHRGPDGRGFFCFEECAMGHSRLSIIDINTGQQPMLTDDKKIGIVFNGEIYGYRSLKRGFKEYDFSIILH